MQKVTKDSLVKGGRFVLGKYGHLIEKYCGALSPELVAIRIWFETRGNPRALSREKEAGLLQLYPWAQEKYGVEDVTDPKQNIRGGCEMWRDMARAATANIGDLGAVWSSSSIGLGATKWLLGQAEDNEFSRDFAGIREMTEGPAGQNILGLGAVQGRFGSQSSPLVHHRLRVAHWASLAAVDLAKERGVVAMDLDFFIMAGAVVAALVTAAYLWGVI